MLQIKSRTKLRKQTQKNTNILKVKNLKCLNVKIDLFNDTES